MANVTRFDSFDDLTHLVPFGDFGNLLRGFALRPVLQDMTDVPLMKLDVTEDDRAYTVKAEIPGVTKDDIKISVDGNQVSVSAEVKKECSKLIHSERYYGQVSRRFTLDNDIDTAAVKAKYADGVLEAVLPKKQSVAAKQIAIS